MALDKLNFSKLKNIDEISSALDKIQSGTDEGSIDLSIFAEDKPISKDDFMKLTGNSIFGSNVPDAIGAENIFEILDKDGSGDLDANELKNYAGLDGNSKNLSVMELKMALYDVIKEALDAFKIENENIRDAAQSLLPTGSDYYNMSPNNGYTAPSGSNAGQVFNQQAVTNPYAGMKLEQLQTEKTKIEGNISKLESEITAAKDNVTAKETELKNATTAAEEAKKNLDNINQNVANQMQSMVETPEEKEKLNQLDASIKDKDTAIETTNNSITTKESELKTTEESLQLNRTSISDKDSAISSKESSISDLNSQLSSVAEGTTDEEKAAAKDKKSEIRSQISKAKEELAKLREERKELETQRNELTEKKESLTKEIQELKTSKITLETEKATLETEKSQFLIGLKVGKEGMSSATATLLENINKAKSDFESAQQKKVEAQSALNTAKEELAGKEKQLDSEKDNLNKVNEQITKKSNNTLSEQLIENALKYLNYKESDGSYHLFTNGRDEAWCADFVSYVAKETYGEDLPEGFGSPAVSNLHQWGKDNGRIMDFSNVQAGDVMIQKNNASHTGIVTGVDRDANGNVTAIHTVEGNTSNMVAERTYKVGSSGYNKITCFVDIDP